MKIVIISLVLMSSSASFAASSKPILSCKLSGFTEEVKAEGTASIVKINNTLRINVDAVLSDSEESHKVKGFDEVSSTTVLTDANLQEEINKDDIAQILNERLGNETAIELTYYQGKNNEDDAAGFSLTLLKGEKGTVKGLLTIGWGVAYCD